MCQVDGQVRNRRLDSVPWQGNLTRVSGVSLAPSSVAGSSVMPEAVPDILERYSDMLVSELGPRPQLDTCMIWRGLATRGACTRCEKWLIWHDQKLGAPLGQEEDD
jgi:hypothetical protein